MNRVEIIGNITSNATVEKLPSGSKVMKFTLAVNDRRKQGEEWVDVANFFNCEMYGDNRINAVRDYFEKGVKIGVAGKLKYHAWHDEDEKLCTRISIVVDDFEFCSSKK